VIARCDVAITGFGPVGATLANLLGQCGVSVVVLEREFSACQLPRAVHFDDEVMRVFQAIGLADQIESKSRYNPGMRFVDHTGKLLLDWPRPAGKGRNGWHTSYRFHQPDLEKILHAGVCRYACVKVIAGAEVQSVDVNSHDTIVNYTDLSSGDQHSLAATYVVGCDGGRSGIRKLINAEMIDLGFRERWLVIDTLLKVAKPELGDFTIQYCNPSRPATYVRGPGNRRRWEITLHEYENAGHVVQPETVWKLLADWIAPHEATIERAAVYTHHSLLAECWRQGGILIAGDAAHQMPPFMGQGMCAGIRDASNLGWKLAACINGETDDSLLDTYQSERYPHVKEFTETSMRLGGLINACGTEEALRLAFRQGGDGATMKTIAPRLGGGISIDNTEFSGALAPQFIFPDGAKHDDRCGYSAALLLKSELADAVDPGYNLYTLTTDSCPEVSVTLNQLNTSAVLIRPDRYYLGGANSPEELKALLNCAHSYGMLRSGSADV